MLDGLVVERADSGVVPLRASDPADLAAPADAFAEFVMARLGAAYRLATVILGDEDEARDVVHDAAERAWRNWAGLRDQQRADAWFQRIVVNGCRDRLRRRGRRRLVELGRGLLEREHPTAPDIADGSGRRDDLRRAFESLNADQRLLVVLRYEEDLTVPAIAQLLDIAEGTVKSRLHSALRALRRAIGEDDG